MINTYSKSSINIPKINPYLKLPKTKCSVHKVTNTSLCNRSGFWLLFVLCMSREHRTLQYLDRRLREPSDGHLPIPTWCFCKNKHFKFWLIKILQIRKFLLKEFEKVRVDDAYLSIFHFTVFDGKQHSPLRDLGMYVIEGDRIVLGFCVVRGEVKGVLFYLQIFSIFKRDLQYGLFITSVLN